MATRTQASDWLRSQAGRLRRWTGRWGKTAVNLLFPPRCAYCDGDLAETDDALLLCQSCRENLGPEHRTGCRRCGATAGPAEHSEDGCELCRAVQLHFDSVVPLARYGGDLRAAILRMKHATAGPLSAAMGDLLACRRMQRLVEIRPDVVVPIPMYWSRRLRRGVNSPEVLARRLALRLGVSAKMRLLIRRRNTLLQPDLPPRARFQNIRGAFRVAKGYDLGGARVLLVDDVLTTGATCSEAAKMLKQAGTAYVAAAVLARAERDR